MKPQPLTILKGTLIHTPTPAAFAVQPGGYLVARDGRLEGAFAQLPARYAACPVADYGESLIIPGFVDLHTHGAQFRQCGLGLDLQLLDWLKTYTFQEERRFADPAYAREVYGAFAAELLRQGTTRAAVLGTIHLESSLLLADLLARQGLGAYVGKVSMDRHCPDFLREDTARSLKETEAFLAQGFSSPLVRPILTPRFAPTSTRELLQGLGRLAAQYQAPVQSHLAESPAEVAWVRQLFPEAGAYHEVYRRYGLFGQTPTLMAHCIHLSPEAIECMRANQVFAVHCPDSNLNLASGIMPVRRLLREGIPVGLGSDVGAGHSLSLPQTLVRAIQLSKLAYLQDGEQAPLTLAEAFYLATKGGGRFFGRVGSFERGYALDALVLAADDAAKDRSPLERLQHFLYAADTAAITARYVEGRRREPSGNR